MKKRMLSVILTLCLCLSSQSVAYAGQEGALRQEAALSQESTFDLAVRDNAVPTPEEVYRAMVALKEQDAYKEGTPWTDDEPYSDSKGYYRWKGGPLDGKNILAVGCVAFAFTLSDEAFGNLPARMYAEGEFAFEDIKVGDILRVNTDTHTVIVLEVHDTGVVIAEGNISMGNDRQGRVHWGRTMSKEEVMENTSHYITRYPEGYIPPDDPTANVSIASGTLDGGLAWNLTKAGTLTISGNGAIPNYSSAEEQPWNDNSSQIREVVIENGITAIGSCAFWNCGVLSAEIPSSVTTIGNSAFRGSALISAVIPSSVKTIGDSAFRECKNLSSVAVSEGVETISQNAFRACASLTSIELPASIGEVGAAAFFQCQALTTATFAPGSKQVKIGDNLFTQCYYLMGVTLPKNIDRIGEGMFQNCLMLTGLEIPQGTESIGGAAFASCSRFTTVLIPDSVTTIGIAAFADCPLADIYYTGTEGQWSSIGKIGDTAAAVSKATIHYNYKPVIPPDPGTGDDNPGGGDNSGSGDNDNSGSGDNDNSGGGDNNSGNGGNDNSGSGDGDNKDNTGKDDAGANPTISITCKKTLYEVAYGTKPFRINASSNGRMAFASSDPKVAAVDANTGNVTVKNTGIVTITIKAGNVSEKVTVKVSPRKPSVKSAKAAKGRKLTVKWAKDQMASGYQVQVSTDKKFKKNVKSKKLSKTAYTFKKLKTGKKYYVRIRSYKKIGKVSLYSTWSKVKLSSRMKK